MFLFGMIRGIDPSRCVIQAGGISTYQHVQHPTLYVRGMRAALYFDNVSGKYVLSFRGTNFTETVDWINNLSQGVTGWSPQYTAAMEISYGLANTPGLRKWRPGGVGLVVTGHSLGGGLAAAGALAADVHGDTFNAAGLFGQELFLKETTRAPLYVGVLDRFADAKNNVDNYVILGSSEGISAWPDARANDILTWIQLTLNKEITVGNKVLNLVPDAVGALHVKRGKAVLTADEAEFIRRLGNALRSNEISYPALFNLLTYIDVTIEDVSFWELLTGSLWSNVREYFAGFSFDASLVTSALGKMTDSHGMEHIFHGLMTSLPLYWNVYDVPPDQNGGFNLP